MYVLLKLLIWCVSKWKMHRPPTGSFQIHIVVGTEKHFITLVFLLLLLDEEEAEAVANDSDSSPPQSRGRGRFEKGRAKVGSRGQLEDTRSTSSSSQAADEESSSHVRQHTYSRICHLWKGVIGWCFNVCVCFSGTGLLFGPAPQTAASAVVSATLVRKKTKREACFTQIIPKKWLHTTNAW